MLHILGHNREAIRLQLTSNRRNTAYHNQYTIFFSLPLFFPSSWKRKSKIINLIAWIRAPNSPHPHPSPLSKHPRTLCQAAINRFHSMGNKISHSAWCVCVNQMQIYSQWKQYQQRTAAWGGKFSDIFQRLNHHPFPCLLFCKDLCSGWEQMGVMIKTEIYPHCQDFFFWCRLV